MANRSRVDNRQSANSGEGTGVCYVGIRYLKYSLRIARCERKRQQQRP